MARSCRDCKHFYRDVDLPWPVCQLHQFHFEGDYSPCSDYNGPDESSSSSSSYSSSGSSGCGKFVVIAIIIIALIFGGGALINSGALGNLFGGSKESVGDVARVEAVVDTGGSTLRLRQGPSRDDKVVASLKDGTVVYVEEEQGEWSKVTVKSTKKSGWCSSKYLKTKK